MPGPQCSNLLRQRRTPQSPQSAPVAGANPDRAPCHRRSKLAAQLHRSGTTRIRAPARTATATLVRALAIVFVFMILAAQLAREAGDDFVLHAEKVGEWSVKAVGPQTRAASTSCALFTRPASSRPTRHRLRFVITLCSNVRFALPGGAEGIRTSDLRKCRHRALVALPLPVLQGLVPKRASSWIRP
jgi:hypothetical protein